MRLVGIILALNIIACGATTRVSDHPSWLTPPVTVAPSYAMDARVRVLVMSSALYWNCAVGSSIFQSPQDHRYDHPIVAVVEVQDSKQVHGRVIRARRHGQLVIAVMELAARLGDADIDWTESVIRHELGHVLGLGHVKNAPNNVMRCPFTPEDQTSDTHPLNATPEQLAEIRARLHVDVPEYDPIKCTELVWMYLRALADEATGDQT